MTQRHFALRQGARGSRVVAGLAVAGLAFVAACADHSAMPTGPEAGSPALALVETPTSDDVLIVGTDVPDNVDYGVSRDGSLTVSSQHGGAGGLDVVFLMDSSGSLGVNGWNLEKTFVSDLAGEILTDTPTGRERVGVLNFSNKVEVVWSLSDQQTKAAVQPAIESAFYLNSYTYTSTALAAGLNQFANHSLPGTGRLMFLITDGVPTRDYDPCASGSTYKQQLDNAGVKVVIIGIGGWSPATTLDCLVDDATVDMISVNAAGDLSSILAEVNTFISPIVNDVRITATLSEGFELNPVPAEYDAATREITWNAGTVDRTADSFDFSFTATSFEACGNTSVLTDIEVSYTAPSTGSTVTETIPDADISVDNCPEPEVSVVVSGTEGANGWYTGDVTVDWTVANATTTAGCDDVTITEDTAGGDYTCDASSAVGTDSETVTVKRDATAPSVAWSGNLGVYSISDDIEITCEATDATSGIATTDCADISTTALAVGAGSFQYSASATDNAGNASGSVATSFQVVATVDGVAELVEKWVVGPGAKGVANSIVVRLRAGKINLKALENHLRALEGKHLTTEQVEMILALARTL